MSLPHIIRLALSSALLMLIFIGVAHAQSLELSSIFEIDPAVALNGFAIFSGAIVVLFETYRSRP